MLRNQTQEKKKAVYASLSQSSTANGHQWQRKGRAYHCHQCLKRVSLRTKLADLEQAQSERCPGTPAPMTGGQQQPEELSKQETVHQILAGSFSCMGAHCSEIQKSYMVCQHCGSRLLRHAAKERLAQMAQTECWNREWQPPDGWQGHGSHRMWRKGQLISCQQCRARAVPKGQDWKASKALQNPCGGMATVALTLPQCFKAKMA